MCIIAGLEVYAVNVFVLDANKPHVTRCVYWSGIMCAVQCRCGASE